MSNNPTQATPGTLIYRKDIDGLRAVAVLSVLLFHAFPSAIPGGFVGVDIFFVISGYLITGILADEVRTNRFSIPAFYARRARRIFPALATVLAAVLAIGWAVLYTDEFQQLGKHVAAGAGFISNLVLWNETGYFDRAAASKPLLHLWSLGVEEQFYILWPLVLALVHRRKAALIGAVCVIMVASFALDVSLIRHHPGATFFSPFTRFWELMIGSGLALGSARLRPVPRAVRNIGSLLGAALCAVAIFGLNSRLGYPGAWALLPTLGAALLIASGFGAAINRSVLSQPLMVGIGKISYPLYLWHWPLLSFSTILLGGEASASQRVLILLVSALLAWLTYRLIESPIRHMKIRWVSVAGPSLMLLFVGSAGAAIFAAAPQAPSRPYSQFGDVATAAHGKVGRKFVSGECGLRGADADAGLCIFDTRDTPHFAMIGDSKAEAMIWGFVQESTSGHRWSGMARGGCAPLVGVVRSSSYAGDNPDDCTHFARLEVDRAESDPQIRMVAIAAALRILEGPEYVNTKTGEPDKVGALDGMDATISELEKAGKRVALIVDNPTLPDPAQCMERSSMKYGVMRMLGGPDLAACTLHYGDYLKVTQQYREMIAKLQALHPKLLVLDPAPLLCDETHGTCPISQNGNFLYSYGDHVSDYASEMLARHFAPEMNAAVQ
ncbi:MAG: acyltransferase family protein [Paraburkholderia sp.]|uniref:acyltransferase family protein n=1 Tax=Paraburkholderia sp. TaxID=1926495 RepID=UPI003C5FF357